MKKKILFSLLVVALVLSFTATAEIAKRPGGQILIGTRGKKTSLKSVIVREDEFTGGKIYELSDLTALRLGGNNFLTLDIVPGISVSDDGNSINLEILYEIGTNEDTLFEKIIFLGDGKKVIMELDASKMTSAIATVLIMTRPADVHVHKCNATISKEEYDLLKEIFASNGDVKFTAYSTMNIATQGKVEGKKYKKLLSDLETVALADNPETVFAENNGVIKISAQ